MHIRVFRAMIQPDVGRKMGFPPSYPDSWNELCARAHVFVIQVLITIDSISFFAEDNGVSIRPGYFVSSFMNLTLVIVLRLPPPKDRGLFPTIRLVIIDEYARKSQLKVCPFSLFLYVDNLIV